MNCPYCAGNHTWNNCDVVYTPINDCEHKDHEDGCCSHPKNFTPECHVNACPRLHPLIVKQFNTQPANLRRGYENENETQRA